MNEREYVKALLADLQQDATLIQGREIETIFIGGGTPSLFSGDAIASLLEGISTRIDCAANLEVTMEANPGSSELRKFSAFRSAGVNRISIGVQSFTSKHLQALGRVHSAKEALKAAAAASQAGFKRINLDIMYALSGQTVGEASRDVEQAVAINPEHLSCYQLTIEPNTQFHAQPPKLPDEELGWEIQQTVHQLLSSADYQQYEVSAWATAGAECRHNLNYWRFGDYLGIGAGAHGKVSRLDGSIERYWKQKHPNKYLQSSQSNARFGGRAGIIGQKQLGFEFLLNALRLKQGFEIELFEQRTGLKIESLAPTLSKQFEKGWLIESGSTIKCSEIGYRFLDDLLTEYLPPP